MGRTRTNIEIDDDAVQRVMDRYGLRTKTEAVDLALRSLGGRYMTREEMLSYAGANLIGDVPEDRGPRGAE